MFYSTIRFMDRYTAKPGPGEYVYVAIEYRDGKIEHHLGPYSTYHNPVHHTSMEVRSAVQLVTPTDCAVVVSASTSAPPFTATAAATATATATATAAASFHDQHQNQVQQLESTLRVAWFSTRTW